MSHKVVLVGDSCSGKTYCLNEMLSGSMRDYDPTLLVNIDDKECTLWDIVSGTMKDHNPAQAPIYYPTLGVDVHLYQVNGKRYNIWDMSGIKYRIEDCQMAQMVIIFGQLGSWKHEVMKVAPDCIIHHLAYPTPTQLRSLLE